MIINPYVFQSIDPVASAIKAKLSEYYPLTEASGSRYGLVTGHELYESTGTIGTASGLISGELAPNFTATNGQYLREASVIGSPMNAPSGGGDHCIFGWFYLNSNTGTQFIVSKWNAGTAAKLTYSFNISGGSLYGDNGGSIYYSAGVSASGFPAANWHFFCVWRDSTDGKVRLQLNNGTTYVSSSASDPAGTIPFVIGGTFSTSFEMAGRVNHVGFTSGSILTADERTWLYNSGVGRTAAELGF